MITMLTDPNSNDLSFSLSDEYSESLQLCWKIRTGFRKSVEMERIKTYSDWFYENNLLPHFYIDEQFVFPVLGKQHELVKLCMTKHRRLKKLFEDEKTASKSLSLIEEILESHVRFEKRKLLIEVQKMLSDKELVRIKNLLSEVRCSDNWPDEFWK